MQFTFSERRILHNTVRLLGTEYLNLFSVRVFRFLQEVAHAFKLLASRRHGPLGAESLEAAVDSESTNNSIACILGRPGEGDPPVTDLGIYYLPGPLWADAGECDTLGKWDVICRVVQLPNNNSGDNKLVEWTGDSSEVLSAVACAAVASASTPDHIIPPLRVSELVEQALKASPTDSSDSPIHIPVRVLLMHSERVAVVHVPVDRSSMLVYSPLETSYDRYRTTFNESRVQWPAAVEPEVAVEVLNQLPTERAVDTISLAEHPAIDVSIIEPLNGYTAILVDQSTLNLPREDSTGLTMYLPDELTERYPQLASILVDVREKVLSVFPALRSETSVPAVCLVGPLEHDGYDTMDGRYLCCCQADLSVRPLTESGEYATALPEPILLALAVAQGLEGSVAYNKWIEAQAKGCGGGRANKVREILGGKQVRCYAAHPSGVLSAQTKFSETDKGRRASFVRLMKTPYELMRGKLQRSI